MLKKIKSVFFIKRIFSYISETNLLNLIEYNRALQKNLDKSLLNYKLKSGKYIINQTNNKAKIYSSYNDKLIIECEYLNGKKNGIYKEYDNNGTLIIECEYLNGKKNWNYKTYNERGNLILDAEYSNDKLMNIFNYDKISGMINGLHDGNGFIKEKNQEGKISFEIEYVNGNIRKIRHYYDNGKLKVEEEHLNEGIKFNKIKEYYKNGQLKSDIECLNEIKWNLKEYDKNNNIINYLKEGKGHIKEFDDNFNLIFEGEYLNGVRNGKGKEYEPSGFISEKESKQEIENFKEPKEEELVYEGEYLNGEKNGKGKEYCNGKIIFEGEYLYNKRIRGKEYYKKNLVFEGEYLYNRKFEVKGYDNNGKIIYELINGSGKVKEYDNSGDIIFEGEYLNGKKHGKGKEYYEGEHLKFEGEYLNGKRNGKGKEYHFIFRNFIEDILMGIDIEKKNDDCRLKLKFEGEYLNGKRNGKGKEYDIEDNLIFEGEYLNGERKN